MVAIDDDGEQIMDVQQETVQDDSQKENIPTTSSISSASPSASLFDKYRFTPTEPPAADAASSTVAKVRNTQLTH